MAVYFIRERCYRGRIKIGYSVNPEKRLKELQTGNSNELYILDQISAGSKQTEKEIHSYFYDKRGQGEWFEIEADDVKMICEKYAGLCEVEVVGVIDDGEWATYNEWNAIKNQLVMGDGEWEEVSIKGDTLHKLDRMAEKVIDMAVWVGGAILIPTIVGWWIIMEMGIS